MDSTQLFGDRLLSPAGQLTERLEAIQDAQSVSWNVRYDFVRLLGIGGQGVVYLADRIGAHDITVRVALKIFSPQSYRNAATYRREMQRIARLSTCITGIQEDHLLDVHNFMESDGVNIMVMEWVDGYDLKELLQPERLEAIRQRVDSQRWEYLNDVVVTQGETHLRLKPGIAIAILRDCLAALAALHRENIAHGDVKPSNIMLKRTGSTKLIDFGSVLQLGRVPTDWACTPHYVGLEFMQKGRFTQFSDLASLGYVLIEMLCGMSLFTGLKKWQPIVDAKRTLSDRLESLLPPDVVRNDLLMNLIRGLIEIEPGRRFENAESAELTDQGAASFHRQLVLSDLASEYDNEIRLWLKEVDDAGDENAAGFPIESAS